MILRKDVGDYQKVSPRPKNRPRQERKHDDFDIGFDTQRIFVLDAHEWFDPHTSTKYDVCGLSRHAMFGPAVIVSNSRGGLGMQTDEHHVNDPTVWAWIRRCIAEGHLTAETLAEGINSEREISIQ